MRICVYAASSAHCDRAYREDARQLGRVLARAGCRIAYGGGAVGSMGALADGALAAGGEVLGIIPRFMVQLEWGWPGHVDSQGQRPPLDGPGWRQAPGTVPGRSGGMTMEFVEDMRERKHRLLTGSDAVVALPGGGGTLEELFEAITLKRLGIYHKPIVLLNTRGYWNPWTDFMRHVVDEGFMNPGHDALWSVVDSVEAVLPAIAAAPEWNQTARDYAVVRPR